MHLERPDDVTSCMRPWHMFAPHELRSFEYKGSYGVPDQRLRRTITRGRPNPDIVFRAYERIFDRVDDRRRHDGNLQARQATGTPHPTSHVLRRAS